MVGRPLRTVERAPGCGDEGSRCMRSGRGVILAAHHRRNVSKIKGLGESKPNGRFGQGSTVLTPDKGTSSAVEESGDQQTRSQSRVRGTGCADEGRSDQVDSLTPRASALIVCAGNFRPIP